jgi:hypothetical protein
MQRLEVESVPRTRVMALFEGSVVSFDMRSRTSLMDLVERLADLGGKHDGALISVAVRVAAKNRKFRLNGRDRGQKRGPR